MKVFHILKKAYGQYVFFSTDLYKGKIQIQFFIKRMWKLGTFI